MGVTAEGELRSHEHGVTGAVLLVDGRWQHLLPLRWDVLEHQHKLSRLDAIECLRHLRALRLVVVFRACHIDGILAPMQHDVLIHQQSPSAGSLKVLHPELHLLLGKQVVVIDVHIIGVIVVSQHAHHAILGIQRTEEFLIRR